MKNWHEIAAGPRPMRQIVSEVAEASGLSAADIYGDSRRKDIVRARQIAQWRIRKELDASLPEIGRHFRRDHTSVLNSLRRVEEMMEGLR